MNANEIQVFAGRRYRNLTTGYEGTAMTAVYQHNGTWAIYLCKDFDPKSKDNDGEWCNSFAGAVEIKSGG